MTNNEANGSWTEDTESRLDAQEGEKYMKVAIACPHCKRTIRVIRIASDEEKILKNVRCKKCPVDGFDWSYKPMEVNGGYTYITACVSVSAENMPKMRRYNERLRYSNR